MIHPFSLMDRDSHPESIYELLKLKVDRALIGTSSAPPPPSCSSTNSRSSTATVVEECTDTVDCALGLPTSSKGRSSARTLRDQEFSIFVERVLRAAEVSLTDILVTIVYLRRARAHLSLDSEKWVLHRVFLGALVLAHKVSLIDLAPHPLVESIILTFGRFVCF